MDIIAGRASDRSDILFGGRYDKIFLGLLRKKDVLQKKVFGSSQCV